MISYLPLAKTLKEKSMTITELALELNVDSNVLRISLNKSQYITVATLMRICEALSCDICDVIEWREGEQNIKSTDRLGFVDVDWDKVENAMQKAGYSCKRLSKDLNRSMNFMQQMKARKGKFKSADFDLLCKLLDVSPEDIQSE